MQSDGAVQCDVLVIGGGPAGSTAAAELARRGRRVLLLEKDRHPRFHIGESLLPLNLPLFEQLGVADEVRAVGLVKPAVEFTSVEHNATQIFPFAEGWPGTPGHAYQVRRSAFDHVLLQNAARRGATVIEGCRLAALDFDRDAVRGQAQCDDGKTLQITARYVVDASGRDTFLAGKLRIKHKHPRHASAAIYGHFRGARRNSGDAEGNISVYWFAHGWMWFIPLADGTTSVGAVCWPYYLKTRDGDASEFFLRTLRLAPALWERVKDAELIAPATATGNYSYMADRMAGDRYVLVGDAFAFVDPVFSSGVYLAMESAMAAATVVDGALDAPAAAPRLARAFERRVRRGLATFSWMIFRMTSPVMRDLIMAPRNVFGVKSAVISFLAGNVYDAGPVRRRIMAFRVIYYLSALFDPRRAVRGWRNRRRNIVPHAILATDGSG